MAIARLGMGIMIRTHALCHLLDAIHCIQSVCQMMVFRNDNERFATLEAQKDPKFLHVNKQAVRKLKFCKNYVALLSFLTTYEIKTVKARSF